MHPDESTTASVSAEPSSAACSVDRSCATILSDLTKPRLALLSTLTALAGYLASPDSFSWTTFLALTLAVFSASTGSLALNQWMEHASDGLMKRTKARPIPSGRLGRPAAFSFGCVLVLIGLGISAAFLLLLPTLLIAATVAIYLAAYTPLKKKSHWCTHLGAVPGALPPLIGWTASTSSVQGIGIWLFFILLLWQMPHFFAIAWLCREDYQRGGMKILSVTHPDGHRLVAENYIYLALLFPVCLGPTFTGHTGWIYGGASILLNLFFLREGFRFAETVRSAGRTSNRLFLYSLFYLPVLLIVLLFDRNG